MKWAWLKQNNAWKIVEVNVLISVFTDAFQVQHFKLTQGSSTHSCMVQSLIWMCVSGSIVRN